MFFLNIIPALTKTSSSVFFFASKKNRMTRIPKILWDLFCRLRSLEILGFCFCKIQKRGLEDGLDTYVCLYNTFIFIHLCCVCSLHAHDFRSQAPCYIFVPSLQQCPRFWFTIPKITPLLGRCQLQHMILYSYRWMLASPGHVWMRHQASKLQQRAAT